MSSSGHARQALHRVFAGTSMTSDSGPTTTRRWFRVACRRRRVAVAGGRGRRRVTWDEAGNASLLVERRHGLHEAGGGLACDGVDTPHQRWMVHLSFVAGPDRGLWWRSIRSVAEVPACEGRVVLRETVGRSAFGWKRAAPPSRWLRVARISPALPCRGRWASHLQENWYKSTQLRPNRYRPP